MTQALSALSVRRLKASDLPAALAIQSQAYPAFLCEGGPAFASRLSMAASYCLAAVRGEALAGYLLAHGWPSEDPPPVDTILDPSAQSEVLFIHDLATTREERGSGIGRRLIARAFELAARDGVKTAELIAVEGAGDYWRRLGFSEAVATPSLAAKVAAYGPAARWMTREIGTVT